MPVVMEYDSNNKRSITDRMEQSISISGILIVISRLSWQDRREGG